MSKPRNEAADIFKWINTHNNDPDVCWEWVGAVTGRDGRGYFALDGKRKQSHHVMYALFGFPNGNIEAGFVHRHKCDNPLCCNPFHIEPGTRSDNEKDKYKRDRQGYTHDMLKEMRRMYKLGMRVEFIVDHINNQFGTQVSRGGVYKILHGDRRLGDAEDDT